MHELLVSGEECHHTHARDGYYVVAPMLPELAERQRDDAPPPIGRELSSADAVLAPEEAVALLRRHALLVEQVPSGNGEMLR